ncbi:30S ribosomal protein S20 [Candidatus Woesebacteria bacterium]|nr:30S ribosomal protein S20 [Candidatus Woesebacteria bacterium]
MPVTKTAKRALRSSARKASVNKAISGKLEIAIRQAKKKKTAESIKEAISLIDRARKKHVIHKNKAARIKSTLSKLLSKKSKAQAKRTK